MKKIAKMDAEFKEGDFSVMLVLNEKEKDSTKKKKKEKFETVFKDGNFSVNLVLNEEKEKEKDSTKKNNKIKFGTVQMDKSGIEWIPTRHSANSAFCTWEEFAGWMKEENWRK